ncbi:MAG TPA: GNAT family N-acetyltransferase [Gaiellaceae bacterium]|nr:GNAT family N-acetyltransferase [Gaiellaceae bacterium]
MIEPTLEQMLTFCAEDPVERVFLEDVARRGLGRFVALESGGSLSALCHVGANFVPSGSGCAAFAEIARAANPRMMIGEASAVSELWAAARSSMARPREDRPGQPVYAITEPPVAGESGLRAATPDDLELLVPACAAAHDLELGVDPLERDPEGFRWRTLAQIEEGRSWLWVEDGVIRFKAEASAWTPQAVQIQQVWVDPASRGRGDGARGLRDLCRLLLERTPTVTLFVRRENAAAIALYDAIGMRRVLEYRSVLF